MSGISKADANAWKGGLLAAVVVTVIGVGLMAVLRTPGNRKPEVAKAKKEKSETKKVKRDPALEPKGENPLDPKATYIAQLTRVVDCTWGEEQKIAQGNHLKPGQEVDLLSGLAEITFHSGAQVILEGPAKFKVVSRTSGNYTTV